MSNWKINIPLIVGGMSLISVLIYVLPFAFIWAVNTIFSTEIVMTFKVWLASWVLFLLFNGNMNNGGKGK